MRGIYLLFGRGLTFGSETRIAQGFVGQSAYRAVRTIDNNFLTVGFTDGDFFGKAEVDILVRATGRNDIFVFTRVLDSITQIDFLVIAVVRPDVQTFVQLFTNLGQCVLNGMYGSTCRTVGMIDSKAWFSDRTIRADGRVQCGCKRFDLLDIYRVGVVRTFGNLSNLVAAVVQTRIGQRHLVRRAVCTNLQTVSRQYAVTRGNFRRNQSCIRQRAVACFQGSRSYAGQRNIVIQLDGNIVVVGGSSDVIAAFDADALTQFFA